MKPKIDNGYWSDPDIERVASEVKLAYLWLISNSQTSIIGVCDASPKRFHFETGLPEEALFMTCRELPRALVVSGGSIWLKNYIRHQFGTGSKLTANRIFRNLHAEYVSLRDCQLREAILKEYPEFEIDAVEDGDDIPIASPSDGVTTTTTSGEGIKEKGSGEKPKPQPLPDDAYLDSLQSNPAYKHLDVKLEYSKMVVWCNTNHKQATRKRLVNWLNRAEKPMATAQLFNPRSSFQPKPFTPGTGNP